LNAGRQRADTATRTSNPWEEKMAGCGHRRSSHTALDYSDDLEVLEIIVPADFKTVDLTT